MQIQKEKKMMHMLKRYQYVLRYPIWKPKRSKLQYPIFTENHFLSQYSFSFFKNFALNI